MSTVNLIKLPAIQQTATVLSFAYLLEDKPYIKMFLNQGGKRLVDKFDRIAVVRDRKTKDVLLLAYEHGDKEAQPYTYDRLQKRFVYGYSPKRTSDIKKYWNALFTLEHHAYEADHPYAKDVPEARKTLWQFDHQIPRIEEVNFP